MKPCESCHGQGFHDLDTSLAGLVVSTTVSCKVCGGDGVTENCLLCGEPRSPHANFGLCLKCLKNAEDGYQERL